MADVSVRVHRRKEPAALKTSGDVCREKKKRKQESVTQSVHRPTLNIDASQW